MDPTIVEAMLCELERWLREEVAPVIASGQNWKAVLNGGAGDVSYVVEKHGKIFRRLPPPSSKVTL